MKVEGQLAEHVRESIASRGLLRRGQAVLVAVSGGVDSMVLLQILAQLAPAQGWRLTVAHFNHQLRGRSSDADERLVRGAAKKLRLPFVVGRADVRAFARTQRLSIEMAARELRHRFLARTAAKKRIEAVALAHHADDQVELFFVRLLRGAGGEGLAGMKWKNRSPFDLNISLVRPLLDQTKSALMAYAKGEKIPFREDATNAQLDIQRNRIRRELLPLLRRKYQPALEKVILRQMEIVGAESDVVGKMAAEFCEAPAKKSFDELPPAVQRRCLQIQLARLGFVANFDLIEQLRARPNQRVTVGELTQVARDDFGGVAVSKADKAGFNSEVRRVRLKDRAGQIEFGHIIVSWKLEKRRDGTFRAPLNRVNCETFDSHKLGNDIMLRHWQPGDRFQPIGMASPVKLKKLFANQKLAHTERHRAIVGTTASGELFWVEGLRLGEHYKLDKNSRYQLQWRWKRVL